MVRFTISLALQIWSVFPWVSDAWVLPTTTIHNRLSSYTSRPLRRKQYEEGNARGGVEGGCRSLISLSSMTQLIPTLTTATRTQLRSRTSKNVDVDGNNNVEEDAATALSSSSSSLPQVMLYNSKARQKEILQPLEAGQIKMYTCGPTVYDSAHVGNFRAFLTYDVIKRVLKYFGYTVTHICNITDVDDKIINRANELNLQSTQELTLKYEALFMEDLQSLNIDLADHYPRATEHIQEMMDMILELSAKQLAYETEDGSWYFDTTKQPNKYGRQLVNLNFEEMEVTDRAESEGKLNPTDFCLWKSFKKDVDRDDLSWESSDQIIKKGRPGWHIECSAMARKYLGETIDIHGGGVDLKFPHHENEIAQSEGVTDKVFCNCWLHNGFVNINDEKMSKSLGNFLTLRGACTQPIMIRAYRYLVASSQYRNPLSFTPDVMNASKNAVMRIDKIRSQIQNVILVDNDEGGEEATSDSDLASKIVPAAIQNFEAALLDDLSMPRAAAALFGLVKAAENEFKRVAKKGNAGEEDDNDNQLDVGGLKAIGRALDQMDHVFGIFYEVPGNGRNDHDNDDDDSEDSCTSTSAVPDEVLELVSQRTEAKEAKDWELADSLRSRIVELGFQVKDVKGGDPIVSRVE